MHLNFLTDETDDVESTVNNIFTRVANGFDLKLFKLTPNKSKNKTIGYSIYLDTSLMAKINTDSQSEQSFASDALF